MKDNFSTQSNQYAKYRPSYPPELFDYINTIVANKNTVWDCGTGNGQVAIELSKTFDNVFATDISEQQLNNAQKANNISYSLQPAEKTNFNNDFFDLIVVAQAIHWFDFEKFYTEVKRTAKQDGLLCVLGYGLLKISTEIDIVINDFYTNTIGSYWDKERRYIDENYTTIPFPFEEISSPNFVNTQLWSLHHLMGYLSTWSAVQHFIKTNHYNPMDQLQKQIEPLWENDELKPVNFPILLRLGRINK